MALAQRAARAGPSKVAKKPSPAVSTSTPRILRLATALLILAAIAVQLFNPDDPWAVAANFFSFFTIQSNLFAAGVLIVVAARSAGAPRSARLEVVRGARHALSADHRRRLRPAAVERPRGSRS